MPTPIDPTRLPRLKEALAACTADEWMPQQQLAEIYDVSNARLTTLIKSRFDAFPDFERRGDKTHWYPARAAIEAMIAYLEGSSAKKQEQARRHTAIMSGVKQVGEQAKAEAEAKAAEPAPMTATELDKLASAQTKIWRLAQEQGLFVRKSEVSALMREALSMFTREVTNLPHALDPTGTLPVMQKAITTKRAREIIMKFNAHFAAFLESPSHVRTADASGSGTGTGSDRRRRGARRSA